MKNTYNKTQWVDGRTPVNAERLNKIENALEDLYDSALSYSELSPGEGLDYRIDDDGFQIKVSQELMEKDYPELIEGDGIKIEKVWPSVEKPEPEEGDVEEEQPEGITFIELGYEFKNLYLRIADLEEAGYRFRITSEKCPTLERISLSGICSSNLQCGFSNQTDHNIRIILPNYHGGKVIQMEWTVESGVFKEFSAVITEDGSYHWKLLSKKEPEPEPDCPVCDELLGDPKYLISINTDLIQRPLEVGQGLILSEGKYLELDLEWLQDNLEIKHPVKVCRPGEGVTIQEDSDGSIVFGIDPEYLRQYIKNIIDGEGI